jgi:hypothetical protein
LHAEQVMRDQAARAEGEYECDRGGERRGDQRQKRDQVEQTAGAARHVGSLRGVGEQEPDRRSHHGDAGGEQEAVAQRAQMIGIGERSRDRRKRKAAVVAECPHEEASERIEHKQEEQAPHHHKDDRAQGIGGAAPGSSRGNRHG